MLADTVAARPATAAADPIRVMVVDDSVVVRGMVTRWLEEESDIAVVGSLRTGREAVERVDKCDPDIVVLDVEMPEMDGLTALPLLLEKRPDLVILMASTLTRRNAEVSIRALTLGATDCIPKPESQRGSMGSSDAFRRDLVHRIRQLAKRRPASSAARAPAAARSPIPAPEPKVAPAPAVFKLNMAVPRLAPRALVIGASTGGPQALNAVIAGLKPMLARVPTLIVQHMPPTFTTILAEHLSRSAGRLVKEPADGDPVTPGVIYLAPGGRHMVVEKRGSDIVVRLTDGPLVNFCKPAVDPLFQAAVSVWQGALMGVILTGMGHDGAEGARQIAAAGGQVVAQDEATSVVWGMPGAAAQAGVCSAVLPLDQIAPKVVRAFSGETL